MPEHLQPKKQTAYSRHPTTKLAYEVSWHSSSGYESASYLFATCKQTPSDLHTSKKVKTPPEAATHMACQFFPRTHTRAACGVLIHLLLSRIRGARIEESRSGFLISDRTVRYSGSYEEIGFSTGAIRSLWIIEARKQNSPEHLNLEKKELFTHSLKSAHAGKTRKSSVKLSCNSQSLNPGCDEQSYRTRLHLSALPDRQILRFQQKIWRWCSQ